MIFRFAALAVVLVLVPSIARAHARLTTFDSVAIAPDGRTVVDLESIDGGPNAISSTVHRLVIRSIATGASTTIECPQRTACTLHAPVWSPDGARIAYLISNEKTHVASVWTVAANGRTARPWLRSFSGVLERPQWSPDGSALAVLATAGAHKQIGATQAGAALTGEVSATLAQDVERIAVIGRTGHLRYASPPDLFVYEYDWLANGRGFAATAARGNGDNNWWIAKLYRIDVRTQRAALLAIPSQQIDAPRVSPDGTQIAFIGGLMSDFGSVGGDVYVVPSAGGRVTNITLGMRASADAIAWDGSDRVRFTGLHDAAAFVASVDVRTHAIREHWSALETITGDDKLDVGFARRSAMTAVVRQTFEQAPEIATGPLGRWRALTHVNAGFQPAVRARTVSWSNDGFRINGWLLAPRRLRHARTHPMIVRIHGGPSAAAGPRFVGRGDIADYIARGYFVFLPNPRGSYGQGERFTAANRRDFGYGDLRDVLAGIDAVERTAPVDDRRLGLTGWSYGGYMTMWAVTQTHRFAAAFAGAGIANWQSYYGENGIDRWMTPFFGATVYADPAVYARSSPITFIRNVKTPTFVVVGERDVECPAPQSLEFWHALSALGVPTSLVIYAGEGHRISRPANREDITRRSLGWFKRYLGS